jgi:phospholipase/carboxylesterase
MAAALTGPSIAPASGGPARQLVIFTHGYGSNGRDLIGLAGFLAERLPDAAFISPNAPERVPGFPGEAYQWFGLSQLDPDLMDAGARAAAPKLNAFIDAELARRNLPASACALVGFSQGTMMALHVGLRRPEPLGAVVGFSGLLTGPQTLPAEIRSRPPVLLAHGDRDDRVPIQALFAALEVLAEANAPVLWRICPGAAHTITEDGLDLAATFLRDALSGGYRGWTAGEAVGR